MKVYLDFETEVDWDDLENMLKRDKKIINKLSLANVHKSRTTSALWKKIFKVAPKVEEIEFMMSSNFRDLPYLLSNLNVFKNLKILNVFIEIENRKHRGKYFPQKSSWFPLELKILPYYRQKKVLNARE